MDAISFGGGVQTTALAILTARGESPYTTRELVMADTGDEKPETYAYLREHFLPWAAAHRLRVSIVRKQPTARTKRILPGDETLYGYAFNRQMVPSINTRWCTNHFKVDPINAWLRLHGASRRSPASIQIGISTDEAKRARPREGGRSYVERVYPLIEMGLSRDDCKRVIAEEGLPEPPKSGCWYCPFQRKRQWQLLASQHPELAAKALALESNALARNSKDMLGGYYRVGDLIGGGYTLDMDSLLENDEECTSGACFL